MRSFSFTKMDGLGNDFVILDCRKEPFNLSSQEIIALSDRKTGVGFDQLIVIEPSSKAEAKILIFNADGSSAGACGNGSRCVGRLLMEEKNTAFVAFETKQGAILKASFEDKKTGLVSVNMGSPLLDWKNIPLSKECETLAVSGISEDLPLPCCVSMGNPHAVFFIKDVERFDVAKYGARIEAHPMFPDRTNVEFAEVLSSNLIRMRVWERGAGITQACGTGACATLVAAVRKELCDEKAEIKMDGGSLVIEWQDKKEILMTGKTHCAFIGQYYF